jgi:hypothetical protein
LDVLIVAKICNFLNRYGSITSPGNEEGVDYPDESVADQIGERWRDLTGELIAWKLGDEHFNWSKRDSSPPGWLKYVDVFDKVTVRRWFALSTRHLFVRRSIPHLLGDVVARSRLRRENRSDQPKERNEDTDDSEPGAALLEGEGADGEEAENVKREEQNPE